MAALRTWPVNAGDVARNPDAGNSGQPGRVGGDMLTPELMGGGLQAEGGQHVSAPVKRGLTVSARGWPP